MMQVCDLYCEKCGGWTLHHVYHNGYTDVRVCRVCGKESLYKTPSDDKTPQVGQPKSLSTQEKA
jgi:hypothetical protein